MSKEKSEYVDENGRVHNRGKNLTPVGFTGPCSPYNPGEIAGFSEKQAARLLKLDVCRKPTDAELKAGRLTLKEKSVEK